jgi:glyoxylase-like metal-dependent hydrolase (beta-lactamase superfamily II)
MHRPIVHTLDLNFHGRPGTIASYLLPHDNGAILVDPGPGSTISNVINELRNNDYEPANITDILLTHIHLDHAGASGWWAKQGATIHVHPNGAPHLINPEKLIASAARIYGNQMESLWGEILPVPEGQLHIVNDNESIFCSNLTIKAVEVPGHAIHQYAYLTGDICFCGDIGGIRVNGLRYLSIPTPPPEFHLEQWRESIQRLQEHNPSRIAPTHFGIYEDAEWHLQEVSRGLDRLEQWMEQVMPSDPPIETLRSEYVEHERKRAQEAGLSQKDSEVQQIANPSFMSADGMLRYWKKYRASVM